MQQLLQVLFFAGMIGDAYTTFFGLLAALNGQTANSSEDIGVLIFVGLATGVITGFNIFTIDIFERKAKIIWGFWLLAVIVDFITSLLGGFGFIKPEANQIIAYGLVFLITIFMSSSPGMLRYILKNPIY
ncbi:hypothetical protein NG798_01350 [Ancylothrix sp. C2]|uniref:hypothetical protein n=1 Tax=Ancylothrix sp. D3o TaxID=2953691 RepID=UPI0021BBA78A|nr:hypothetical protein [Ancylothrix sp. D3o]MCT7948426.1 hypothetical protein [Ancylothrix sp. D3o]